jgi:hypothetical protein
MDSLNSLRIGFYTLSSYSYSQRHTHTKRCVVGSVTLVYSMLNGVARKNRNEFFFFQANRFLILHSLSAKKYICTRAYFVFVLPATLREGTYLQYEYVYRSSDLQLRSMSEPAAATKLLLSSRRISSQEVCHTPTHACASGHTCP